MKKFYFLLLFIFSFTLNAQIVNIPDANFKNALLTSLCVDADLNGTYESDADLNNDGQIQTSEALLVQRLKVNNKNISDLTGIQSFTNLKRILCNNNLLTTVDFSSNINLQQIDCQSNSFVSLVINGLPSLNTLNIYPNNSLQNLTVTNNPSLTTLIITGLTSLVNLNCSNNALSSLQLYNSSNPLINLINVDCSHNQITSFSVIPSVKVLNASNNSISTLTIYNTGINSIDVSNNALTYLSVYNCNALTTFNFNGNLLLNTLGVNNTALQSLSVHEFPNLQNLNCSYNEGSGGIKLNALEIYDLPALTNLNCYNNNIVNLNISNFPNLTSITYSENPNINLTLSNLPLIANYTADSGNSISVNNMSNLVELYFENQFDNISIDNNPLLSTVSFSQNSINQFQISNCDNLTNLYFSCLQFNPYNLNLALLPSLTSLILNINDSCNLGLNNLPSLHNINIKGVTSFNFHDLPQLYTIKSEDGELVNFSLNNLPSLHELLLKQNNLTELIINDLPNLYSIDVSNNGITNISLLNLPQLHDVNLSYGATGQAVYAYNFSNLPNLYDLNLNFNLVSTLTFNNLPALHNFSMRDNSKISTLDLSDLPSLYDVYVSQCNNLSTFLLNNLPSLYMLKLGATKIQGISLVNLPSLFDLQIQGNNYIQNNNIVLTNLPSLNKLNLMQNNLSSFVFNYLPNLSDLNISINSLYNLDLMNLPALSTLDVSGNSLFLQSLDLSLNPNISYINYSNGWYYDQLRYINLRNGSDNLVSINVGNSITNICVDNEAEKNHLISLDSSLTNTVFTTYCSFNPTGVFYTLEGNSLLDVNNNGCDTNDIVFPNINFIISSASFTTNNSFFGNATGAYSLPFSAGQYTLTPSFENSSYYTFSPAFLNIDFPSQTSPQVQNFCIIPNGNHNDLEIVLVPFNSVIPGFDTKYKIVYKNIGNQIESGTLNLGFDDSVLDFVSASPVVTNQTLNNLSWDFTNLQPFETREIILTLNVNSPMETPAVNGGDVLNYSATITSLATDETPEDNTFTLNQTVVNSYDPNDKTCLEGTTITPSEVGKYVHYVIRFENTGTYPAENIVVKDMIDTAKFDVSTLVPIKGSHDFYTRINGNKVEFIFENINLPFDDANNDGYVAFKIKTKPTLVNGDTFSNSASIYFDYNFPIVTNTATTTIQTLGTQDFEFGQYFNIYPNPVNTVLNVDTKETIEVTSISIYNQLGQLVVVVPSAQNVKTVDVSNLSAGNYFIKINSDKGTSNAKFIKR